MDNIITNHLRVLNEYFVKGLSTYGLGVGLIVAIVGIIINTVTFISIHRTRKINSLKLRRIAAGCYCIAIGFCIFFCVCYLSKCILVLLAGVLMLILFCFFIYLSKIVSSIAKDKIKVQNMQVHMCGSDPKIDHLHTNQEM